MRLNGKIESLDYLWVIIVILIILVISSWIPYIITAKEFRQIITTKPSGTLTFVRNLESLLRNKFELQYESTYNPEHTTTTYGLPAAEAASSPPFSSTGVSLGIVNQYNTSSSQTGLAVDTYPVGVAVNPVTKKIYATDEFSNTVSVISGTSNSVEGTITVGSFPYGVAVNPFDSRVYVTNRGTDTVSVIDGSTNTKLHNITVQNSPVGVAVNPSANWIYVTNINSNTVSVIDGITDKVTSNIMVGKIPYSVAANPLTKKVYVTNIGSDSVSVIDGLKNKVTANITVGKNPVGIAVNPTTNTIYVTNYASDSVSVIDGSKNKVTANITVGKNPVGIAVNPITSKVYVTNIQSNTVSVINSTTNKVMSAITVNPSLGGAYTRIGDPVLSIPIAAKFPLIASLVGVDDITNMIYVTNTGSNTVSIIDGKTDSVVIKVGFNVNPPNSGDIECNGQHILPDTYILYRNSTNLICSANAGQGYKFSSWSNIAYGSSNPLNLKVSQFGGTLTANFNGTLSLEQYLAIIIGPISIISIIVGWLFRSRQRRYLNKYMTLIDVAYETLQDNKNSRECLLRLQLIRKEVTHLFKKGKINDSYYNILQNKISEYMVKINS
jgi:YVTN family beta-propeller protein